MQKIKTGDFKCCGDCKETIKYPALMPNAMNKKSLLLCALAFILLYSIAVHSEADSEIEELFGDDEEIEVIVVLKDDYNVLENNYDDDLEEKKMMISKQQEKVLNELDYITIKQNDSETSTVSEISETENNSNDVSFKLKNKFTMVNAFSGEVTEQGFEELKNNPNIKEISLGIR